MRSLFEMDMGFKKKAIHSDKFKHLIMLWQEVISLLTQKLKQVPNQTKCRYCDLFFYFQVHSRDRFTFAMNMPMVYMMELINDHSFIAEIFNWKIIHWDLFNSL